MCIIFATIPSITEAKQRRLFTYIVLKNPNVGLLEQFNYVGHLLN